MRWVFEAVLCVVAFPDEVLPGAAWCVGAEEVLCRVTGCEVESPVWLVDVVVGASSSCYCEFGVESPAGIEPVGFLVGVSSLPVLGSDLEVRV